MLCGTCQAELPAPDDVTERYVTCTKCGTTTDTAAERTDAGDGTAPRRGSAATVDLSGTTLGSGTYLIEEKIGQGGMGQVYRGKHLRLNQDVAIKIISPLLASEPEFIARFQREGQTLGRIRHDGVVRVFDANREDDLHYIVMEYVPGPDGRPCSLRDVMRSGPLDPKQALNYVAQACDALQYIHSMGIIHRDVKPGNFLIDENGRPLVADFGIATVRGPAEQTYTATGAVMGDPTYMSPEQRVNVKGVDERTDVYSLGLLLYEALAGEAPLGHFDPPSVMRPGLPKFLDGVVIKALKQAPDARYQTMAEFGEAVRTALARLEKPQRKVSGKVLRWAIPALLILVVAALVVGNFASPRSWFSAGDDLSDTESDAESDTGTTGPAPDAMEEPLGKPEPVPMDKTPPPTDPQAFAAAVHEGDAAGVERMLEAQPELMADAWPEPEPPLHVAVRNGHAEVLDVLVAYGADTEAREPELGRTALHLAALQGDSHMARLLLNAFADANATDRRRDTPLHLAVSEQRLGTINLLLDDFDADPTAVNARGETPVSLAESAGMTEVAERMRRVAVASTTDTGDPGVVIDAPDEPAVEPEATPGPDVVVTKPDGTPLATDDPTARSAYPLHDAAASGTLETLKALLSSGRYDANEQRPSDGNTPLHVAAAAGRTAFVEYLLNNGGSKSRNIANRAKELPIDLASKGNHKSTFDTLKDWKGGGGR